MSLACFRQRWLLEMVKLWNCREVEKTNAAFGKIWYNVFRLGDCPLMAHFIIMLDEDGYGRFAKQEERWLV